MKKVLMVLLTGALAVCALTSCNEPETATLDDVYTCSNCHNKFCETAEHPNYYYSDPDCQNRICEDCYKIHEACMHAGL